MRIRVTLSLILGLAGLFAIGFGASGESKTRRHVTIPVVAAKPEDVSSIEAIVNADYKCISGGVGVARQWGRDLSLYDPHAWLVSVDTDPKTGTITKASFSEQEYVDRTDARFVKDGFTEHELGHRIYRFGNIATMLSSYEGKFASTGKVASRGVNIYQLYFDGKRWWILSVAWNDETPGNPIPAELLPKG